MKKIHISLCGGQDPRLATMKVCIDPTKQHNQVGADTHGDACWPKQLIIQCLHGVPTIHMHTNQACTLSIRIEKIIHKSGDDGHQHAPTCKTVGPHTTGLEQTYSNDETNSSHDNNPQHLKSMPHCAAKKGCNGMLTCIPIIPGVTHAHWASRPYTCTPTVTLTGVVALNAVAVILQWIHEHRKESGWIDQSCFHWFIVWILSPMIELILRYTRLHGCTGTGVDDSGGRNVAWNNKGTVLNTVHTQWCQDGTQQEKWKWDSIPISKRWNRNNGHFFITPIRFTTSDTLERDNKCPLSLYSNLCPFVVHWGACMFCSTWTRVCVRSLRLWHINHPRCNTHMTVWRIADSWTSIRNPQCFLSLHCHIQETFQRVTWWY